MRIVTSVAGMQRRARRWRRAGTRVGFVPTMGYLHAGHVSLVRKARRAVGNAGIVVVSIFVNPTQFGPKEDFRNYPRDLKRDATLCRAAGVDILFAPHDGEMYPPSGAEPFSTFVDEEQLGRGMEGASRPTHFRGVTTIVAKLFNLVLPGVAVFGAKDFQQAAVIRRMTRDLNFPVKILVAPTTRAADGLALSSRNKYLSEEEHPQAAVLYQALQRAATSVRKTRRPIRASQLRRELTEFIERQPAARVDYIAFFDSVTLQPASEVRRGVRMALAVFIGKTRLIDNGTLR